jgi:nitroreductase
VAKPARPGAVQAAILGRRSVREGFSDDPVPIDVLREVVRCGLAAPSSKNAQPWRFHVLTDRRRLTELADAMVAADNIASYVPHDPATGAPRPKLVSTVVESAAVLRDVPAAIIVENRGPFSGGVRPLLAASGEALRRAVFGFALEHVGIGAAVQNLMLSSEELGLRCAFMGDIVIAEAWLDDNLALDGDVVGALAIGYARPAPSPARQPRDPEDAGLVRWMGRVDSGS